MKKKVDENQVSLLKDCLNYKVFNIIVIDKNTYYIDKEFKLIWNGNKDVVGLYNDKQCVFFNEIDNIIDNINR